MKVTIEKLGSVEGADIDVKPLTILVGGNNTGKTYVMYVLWNILQRRFSANLGFLEEMASSLRAKGVAQVNLPSFLSDHLKALENAVADGTRRRLPNLFRGSPELFESTRIKVDVESEAVIEAATANKFSTNIGGDFSKRSQTINADKPASSDTLTITQLSKELPLALVSQFLFGVFANMLIKPTAKDVVLLPAERAALNIFAPDLDTQNAALLRQLKRERVNVGELIEQLTVAQYAEPIEEYLRLLKRFPRAVRTKGLFHDDALELQKKIAKVRYKVDKDGLITAQPYKSDAVLGLHLTSSTVKNIYGLWAYLEGMAEPGDCLMIDEPELNLHPDNQRLVARALARLVNRGIRVVISTHSDYMIREFNNLIMLSQAFAERDALAQKYGYEIDAEALSIDKVSAYHFSDSSSEPIKIESTFGIEVKSMDDAMSGLNSSNTEIHFALSAALGV